MPVVLRYKGYRFFFHSNEGDPQEPLHIHIQKGAANAKIWLEPQSGIADSYGLAAHELNELLAVAIENKELIRRYWNEYFAD